jgi:hypothetical protein
MRFRFFSRAGGDCFINASPTRSRRRPAPAARRIGIVISQHTDEDGGLIFQQACNLEGIVSKRLSASYRLGTSRDWVKIKNPNSPAMIRAREAVVVAVIAETAEAVAAAVPAPRPSDRRSGELKHTMGRWLLAGW